MKISRLLSACAVLLAAGQGGAAAASAPSLSADAPYQEFVLPVGQKAAHKAAIAVIVQMGFQFPVPGPQAEAYPPTADVDQWQRFQFNGMSRFSSLGPEEGTIIAVRVDDADHYDSSPSNMATKPGKDAITSHFQQDPHPGFYHAAMLRADFSDQPNGGTKVQVWITNSTLATNSLSGDNFGATIGQQNIPTNKSPLYGQFFTKLAKTLRLPKPVGIAPSGAGY